MKPLSNLSQLFRKLPLHLAIVIMCILWLVPTLGLFITSLRTRQAVSTSGWWTVFAPSKPLGAVEYNTYCASCHGEDGKKIANANLADPAITNQFTRSINLLVDLQKPINNEPHLINPQLPTNAT